MPPIPAARVVCVGGMMSGSLVLLSQEQRDRMLRLIQDAVGIRCHLEFFVWLQLGIGKFLPHDLLVSAWGDFESGRLQFDIASKLPRARSNSDLGSRDFVAFMQTAHAHWHKQNRESVLMTRLDCASAFLELPSLNPYHLANAQSCLVHGMHDTRTQQDCLYMLIAFDQCHDESMKPLCNILIPHVDATLRRIEALPAEYSTVQSNGFRPMPGGLTAREQEIMHWVAVGKTNHDIGQILNISANTAKNHLRHIFKKLNVTNRAQAVAQFKGR